MNRKDLVQKGSLKSLKEVPKVTKNGNKARASESQAQITTVFNKLRKGNSQSISQNENGQLSFPACVNPFINHNSAINSGLNNNSDYRSTSCDTASYAQKDGKQINLHIR